MHQPVADRCRTVIAKISKQSGKSLMMIVRKTMAYVLVAKIATRAVGLEQAGFKTGGAAIDG